MVAEKVAVLTPVIIKLLTLRYLRSMKKGYSLIELLISLTIMAIVFGLGYAGFRQFARNQAMEAAIRQLMGDLRLAQQYSLSGKKPSEGCEVLNSYRVTFTLTNYAIQAICNGATPISIGKDSIPLNQLGITLSPTPASITFKILGQGTTLGVDALITLTQAETNNTATITVTTQGEIK